MIDLNKLRSLEGQVDIEEPVEIRKVKPDYLFPTPEKQDDDLVFADKYRDNRHNRPCGDL